MTFYSIIIYPRGRFFGLYNIKPFSFCFLLVAALLGLDNSAVSLNPTNTNYLEEEVDILWQKSDPLGQEIFLSRADNRLPKWELLFKEAAKNTDQHWTLLAAISYQESHWNPKAISKTGVRGLMMLTQTTAKEVGISRRTDPKQSVFGGSIYFQRLLEKLPKNMPRQEKLWMTVAAYNLGFSYLKEAREIAKSRNLNPNTWEDVSYTLRYMSENEPRILTKTRIKEALDYVEKVRLYYQTLSVKERKNSKPF
ncbi:MAG: hypothetical protein EVA53_01360 [Gammaproteobacteria bacterium]|nr:MAG: hypothetical protein EVA53_01360 [Gammaproteobacteria bacterium]